jgi:UDP-glucose 4-epimerase
MKILITGGCGYLGGYFIKHLNKFHQDIEEIRIYDNLSRGDMAFLFGQSIDKVKVALYQHDILDRRNLLKALEGVDVVVHMAAKIVQPYTDLELHQFDQVNNWGTSNVADAIQDSDVKKAIYISSVTVYGSHGELITEDSSPEPQTSYGRSKHNGEKHFSRLENKEVFILRCANAYGYSPTMRIDSVINRFMFEAHHKGKVNRIGDGEQSRAFISLESFSKQLSHVIFDQVEPGVYNLADTNYQINDILDLYYELYPKMEVITIEQNSTLQSVNVKVPTKLAKEIKLETPDIRKVLNSFKETFSF